MRNRGARVLPIAFGRGDDVAGGVALVHDLRVGIARLRADTGGRIGATGPAAGVLEVGERIMSVQGAEVTGPLFAARMLRESEGYVKIVKLPKRDDFDENLEEYQAKEAQLARDAMVAANQIGQQPQSTPRTDAATPRGPRCSSSGSTSSSRR